MVTINNSKEDTTLTSITALKVLMYLHYCSGKIKFVDLIKSMKRSKSQLSTLLKKMDKRKFITKSLTRPIIISITDEGEKIRRNFIKELANFKKEDKKQSKNDSTKKNEKIEKFTRIVEEIVKNEILQSFRHNIQRELVRDIARAISNKINDSLYSFFKSF